MNNSSIEANHVDPDPTATLFLSIWFVIIGIFGIPLNIFIVVATVKVQEIRAVPSNMFIGSLAMSDALFLLSFLLHLPNALISDETLCKISGIGVSMFGVLSACHPPFLAINRYAIVCRQQEKLALKMYAAFSRKGICLMIFILWAYEIIYQVPFIILNTFVVRSGGFCTTFIKESSNNVFIRIYFYCGMLGVLLLSYFPVLIFYRKVSLWVKTMTARLSMSVETKKTIRETENALRLTKWVTVIPLIFCSPLLLISVLVQFDSKIVSAGMAYSAICLYPLISLFNAIITLKFARAYRLALKNVCDRATFTSILFSWIIEGQWRNKIDAVEDDRA